MRSSAIDCLQCGMRVPSELAYCPKCDNDLKGQTDGSIVTEDIAHHHERVHQALDKMHGFLEQAHRTNAASLRLIVGSGVIRDAVQIELGSLLFRGQILSWSEEGGNPGAVLVQLKKTANQRTGSGNVR